MTALEKKVRQYIADTLVQQIDEETIFKELWEETDCDDLEKVYKIIRKCAKEINA